jgi:hypothetical protein
VINEIGSAMTDKFDALGLLPKPQVSHGRSLSFLKSSKAKALKPAKKLRVVEAKKILKLAKGSGKSVASIETMPDGCLRVNFRGSAANLHEENPFDEVLK